MSPVLKGWNPVLFLGEGTVKEGLGWARGFWEEMPSVIRDFEFLIQSVVCKFHSISVLYVIIQKKVFY